MASGTQISRVVGGAYTVLSWLPAGTGAAGSTIARLDGFNDSGQQIQASSGGNGYEAVTPLGSYFPAEFALGTVMGEGQLQIHLRELWNSWAWEALGLTGNNISDIMSYQAGNSSPIVASMTIVAPQGRGVNKPVRTKQWFDLTVVRIDDSETVTVGALTMPRTMTCVYTHYTVTGGVLTTGGLASATM
jgi:hypothetical protein